jgi:hypothetical protein
MPFHEIRAPYQVMVAVTKGQRPSRPSHDHSMIHGLDNLWTLIEACWATHPANRLTASQIVDAIRSWPDRSADRRAPQQWDDVSAAIMAVFEDVASNLSQDNLPALVESDPVCWQSINTHLIISAIDNLTKLSRSDALECSKIVQDVGVYQVSCFVRNYDSLHPQYYSPYCRSSVFWHILSHICDFAVQMTSGYLLMFQNTNKSSIYIVFRVLEHIKQVAQVWRTWDAVTSLSNYWLVKKDLFACLRESQQVRIYASTVIRHSSFSPLFSGSCLSET